MATEDKVRNNPEVNAYLCSDLKTKLLCYVVDGIVFLPYGHWEIDKK